MSIEFHFDYASPWAFLANAVLAKRFAGIDVTYHPLYLRGLESFANGMPYGAAKTQYVVKDFMRCAAYEEVPIASPAVFPLNGVHALRGALVTLQAGSFAKYHEAIFRAAWQESRDIGNKDVVKDVAREAGVDAESIARFDDEGIKRELRARTEQAAARGIFGVPAFMVGEELFWGHDRMEHAAREARARGAARGG